MRLLIVEDQPIAAISLAMDLEESGHVVVGPAATSSEAIRLARRVPPDLALVDITLSGPGDGIDVVRALAQLGIPSLFLTAQSDLARANADAALGLISKPYTTASVCRSLEVIAALLEGRTPAAEVRELELFY